MTDADFALGYLDAAGFAEGNVAIDLDAGSRALSALATAADLDTLILAAGIHDVVNESMASAARVHVAEQGRDPRDFTLLCTGALTGPCLRRGPQARHQAHSLSTGRAWPRPLVCWLRRRGSIRWRPSGFVSPMGILPSWRRHFWLLRRMPPEFLWERACPWQT